MNTANSFEVWTDRLAQHPEVFPHQLNLISDSLLLMELSAAEVSAASFLDQRILKQTSKGSWVPWQPVADIFENEPVVGNASFIFHVGHCGSTLLSRLLEFESLLQNPADTLAQLLRYLDMPADGEVIEKAVRSPVLQTYPKAPEHKYNAETRAAILADSRARFGQDISAAIAWLENLAGQSGLVAATMQKFAF